MNSCLRTDDFLPENSYVCSEHFSESDYERDLKAELMNLPPKRILKPESKNLPFLYPYLVEKVIKI